jgi:hypothetical protein
MFKPYEFSFDTILERAESVVEVHVVARVESASENAGFLNESSRVKEVTILRTEYRGEPLTEDEEQEILNQAMGRLCFH